MTTDDITFQKIRTLIGRYDPEALLDIAPGGEYDPEARALLELVHGRREITGATVTALWLRYFGASRWPAERPAEPVELAAALEALRRERSG